MKISKFSMGTVEINPFSFYASIAIKINKSNFDSYPPSHYGYHNKVIAFILLQIYSLVLLLGVFLPINILM
jgi:hypothetical protein